MDRGIANDGTNDTGGKNSGATKYPVACLGKQLFLMGLNNNINNEL